VGRGEGRRYGVGKVEAVGLNGETPVDRVELKKVTVVRK